MDTTDAWVTLGLWFAAAIPIAVSLGLWGLAIRRRERGLGWVLMCWALVMPLLPPVLTVGTWLAFGDAAPADVHEPLPYYAGVALYSFGAAIAITPLLVVIAAFWLLAAPSPDSREAEVLDDQRR